MDKATRILAIPLTSASYPESMDDLLDTISFHWRDSKLMYAYLVQYAVRSIILRLRQTMQHMYMYRYRYTCAHVHVHVQFRDAAVQRAAACTCTCSISLYASHLADLLVGDTAELLASSQSAAVGPTR